jgi:hypothetical protein
MAPGSDRYYGSARQLFVVFCWIFVVLVWLFGCLVVWLLGCLVVWLFGCLVVWLFGCLVVVMVKLHKKHQTQTHTNWRRAPTVSGHVKSTGAMAPCANCLLFVDGYLLFLFLGLVVWLCLYLVGGWWLVVGGCLVVWLFGCCLLWLIYSKNIPHKHTQNGPGLRPCLDV